MTEPETNDLPQEPTDPTAHFFQFLNDRFWSIVLVGVILALLGILLGFELSIPRWLFVYLLATIFLLPVGYPIGSYLVSLLWQPDWVYLLDVDARRFDNGLARIPYKQFAELEVTDGDLDRLGHGLYAGKNLDLEEAAVKGCWRGSVTDVELIREQKKIDECREMLEDQAKRGFAIETTAHTMVRNATRDATLAVVNTFESATLPDQGDGITNAVNNALSEYGLKRFATKESDGKEDSEADLDPRNLNGKEPQPNLQPEVPTDD